MRGSKLICGGGNVRGKVEQVKLRDSRGGLEKKNHPSLIELGDTDLCRCGDARLTLMVKAATGAARLSTFLT